MNAYTEQANPRRMYRDPQRGVFFGVCAGIADYFGFRVGMTRIITVIAFLFAPIVLLLYIGLIFLLPRRPQQLYRDADDEQFWRSVRSSPSATFSSVRYKFRDLDARMQRLERYVTSSRFDLDREFRDLERES